MKLRNRQRFEKGIFGTRSGKAFLPAIILMIAFSINVSAVPVVSIGNASTFHGGVVSIPINLSEMNDFGAITIDMVYDPTKIYIENASIGFSGFGGDLTSNLNYGTGKSRFVIDTSARPGPNGPLTLANISIRAIGLAGSAGDIKLEIPTLADTEGNYITPTAKNGTITIVPLQVKSNARISVGNISIGENGYVRSPIKIYSPEENPSGISAVGIKLCYDPKIVNAIQYPTDTENGDFVDFFSIDYRNASDGCITINTFKIGNSLRGNINIAYPTFKAIGVDGGRSSLTVEILDVADDYANSVPTDVVNGDMSIIKQKLIVSGDEPVILDSTVTRKISLSEVPNGLAGYNITVSLSNPAVAEIVAIDFPAWVTMHDLHKNKSVPDSVVWAEAIDPYKQIENGAKNVPLFNITLLGKSAGYTEILLYSKQIDDDEGYPIIVSALNGNLNVQVESPSAGGG